MAWTKPEKDLVDERIGRIYDAIDSNAKLNQEYHKAQMTLLKDIKTQTNKTNGRVDKLEQRADRYYLLEKYPAVFIIGAVIFGLLGVFTFLATVGIIGS